MKTSNVLQALAALAQETRLAFYRLLVEHAPKGLPAGQIAERLGIPPPSLSFHLKELWRAGLVVPSQVSRFVWYRADLDAMNGLVAYLPRTAVVAAPSATRHAHRRERNDRWPRRCLCQNDGSRVTLRRARGNGWRTR